MGEVDQIGPSRAGRLSGALGPHPRPLSRPAHPDRLPVIDRVPSLSNAWLTSGHYKTGILNAAATGRALAEWVRSGNRPPEVAAFNVQRLLAAA